MLMLNMHGTMGQESGVVKVHASQPLLMGALECVGNTACRTLGHQRSIQCSTQHASDAGHTLPATLLRGAVRMRFMLSSVDLSSPCSLVKLVAELSQLSTCWWVSQEGMPRDMAGPTSCALACWVMGALESLEYS